VCTYVRAFTRVIDDGTDKCLRQTGAPTMSFFAAHTRINTPASRCRENYDGRPAPSPLVHLSILLSLACASLRRACLSVLSVEKGIAPERGGAGQGGAGQAAHAIIHPSICRREGAQKWEKHSSVKSVTVIDGQPLRRGRQIGRERERGSEGRVGAGRTATFLAPSPSPCLPVRGHDET